MLEIANGTEKDGIRYRCWYESPNWVVEVESSKGGRKRDFWYRAFEPTFGPDVVDVAEMEKRLEQMIQDLRKGGQGGISGDSVS